MLKEQRVYMIISKEAYDRERRLMPVLVEGTRRGIRISREELLADYEMYQLALNECAESVRNRLKNPALNLGSPAQLAAALNTSDVLSKPLPLTATGKSSIGKEGLIDCIADKDLLYELLYTSSLETCIGTFMQPWLIFSEVDGRVHPEWNQVRDTDRGGRGTRTGRLSSSKPNFQNVPTEFRQSIPSGFPPLPLMRRYCLPEEGHLWVKRDFSGQEIRILAHFEDGTLLDAYGNDPDLDPHEMVRQIIKKIIGVLYDRKDVKITGFSIIYGSGARGIAAQLHKTVTEATNIKKAFLKALPGVKSLNKSVQTEARLGNPIRTWGGRYYSVESPKIIRGRKMEFYYKLLNYLIQGSAADQTKQVLADWYFCFRGKADVYLATVHDEINLSVPETDVARGMARLKDAMDQPLFDVPMRSEGFVGENWDNIQRWDDANNQHD